MTEPTFRRQIRLRFGTGSPEEAIFVVDRTTYPLHIIPGRRHFIRRRFGEWLGNSVVDDSPV